MWGPDMAPIVSARLSRPCIVIIIIVTSSSDLQPSTAIANQLLGESSLNRIHDYL